MSQDNKNDKPTEPRENSEQRSGDSVNARLHEAAYPQVFEPNRLVYSGDSADVMLVVKQSPTATETLVRLPANQNEWGDIKQEEYLNERELKKIKIGDTVCYYDKEGNVWEKADLDIYREAGVKHVLGFKWLERPEYRVVKTDTLTASSSHEHYAVDSVEGRLDEADRPTNGRRIEMKDGTVISDDGPDVKPGSKEFKLRSLNDKYVTRIDGKAYLVTADGQVLSQNERGQFVIEPRFEVKRIGQDMESALQYVDENGKLKLPNDNMTVGADGKQVIREAPSAEPLDVERAVKPAEPAPRRPGGAVHPFDSMLRLDSEKYFDFGSIIKKNDGTIIYDMEKQLARENVADGGRQPFGENVGPDAKVVRIHGQAYIMTADGKVISQNANGQLFLETRFKVTDQGSGGEPIGRYKDASGAVKLPQNFLLEFRDGYKMIKDESGVHRMRPDGSEVKSGEPARVRAGSEVKPAGDAGVQAPKREGAVEIDKMLRPMDRLTEREIREVKQLRESMEAKPNLTPQQAKDLQALKYLEKEMAKPRPDLEPTIREVRKGLDLHRAGRASGIVMLAIIAVELATKRGEVVAPPQPKVTIF